jgi:hypothetical protein
MWRGLFRLWVVGAALWAGVLGFLTFGPIGPNLNSFSENMTSYVQVAVIPPIIILAIGFMLRWAFGGFSRNS